jgi:hypothetical protein
MMTLRMGVKIFATTWTPDDVDAIRLRPHPFEFNLYFDV